jgi:C-terminal processing protease CtpA/Prc
MYTICRKTAWAAVISLFILGACKKDHGDPVNPATDEPGKSANDSMYFIFKDIYLWTDVVPDSATFKPNSYTNLEDMFNALKSYKKNGTNNNMDHYSVLDDGTIAGEIGEGIAGDFGLDVGYNGTSDLRIVYVYEGSPAGRQSIHRGWQITAVNGNTNMEDDNGANAQRIGNAIYNSNTVQLRLKKPDGSSVDVTLNAANYNINPVLYSNTYTLGGKKIGYLVFNTFIDSVKAKAKLDPVFDNFISYGVTDLVVDLRYNGGGSVSTASYLANLIAPSNIGNSVMFKETFNTNITNKQYSNYLNARVPGYNFTWGQVFEDYVDYATTYFSKQKSLNISNLVFIGTGYTASASELLINVLKPYVPNLKLVGTTTYGKPVGFIGIPVGGWDMYAVSMWSKNAQGQGDYFDGFTPDGGETMDDYGYDWGQTTEPLFRKALTTLGVPENELGRVAPRGENLRKPRVLQDRHFKGMIETRFKLK